MNPKSIHSPTSNGVIIATESAFLMGNIEMNVVNNDNQAVDTLSNLWGNSKLKKSAHWGNEA